MMSKEHSQAQNLFWLTILILLVFYIILQFFAYQNTQTLHNQEHTIVPKKITALFKEIIVDDLSIQKSLEENATRMAIEHSIQEKLGDLNSTIDHSIEHLFAPVYQRIDHFLDFHYSVIGEYSQLGLAVTGKIEESIKEKLFGVEFAHQLKQSTKAINKVLIQALSSQERLIYTYSTKDIDKRLNRDLLARLKADIDKSLQLQQNKVLTLLAIGVSYKLIIATLSSKLAIKGAIKVGSKIGAASSGLVAGSLCGPGAVVCSPLFALGVWLGSDALLISVDEYLHRDAFKAEITRSIDEQKQALKEQYKQIYEQALRKETEHMIEKYKETPIKKRERVRVKERIER